MNKICIACNKRPARIKFIKIVDGEWQDCMICQTCMMKFAQQQKGGILKLDDILRGLMEEGGDTEAAAHVGGAVPRPTATELSCSSCGLAYVSYRNTLILGCSDCYDSFAEQLEADLRRIHGATHHVGRGPSHEGSAGEIVPVEPAPAEAKEAAPAEKPSVFPPAKPAKPAIGPPKKGLVPDSPEDILALRSLLREAAQEERFEEAAELRDLIRQAEERLKRGDRGPA